MKAIYKNEIYECGLNGTEKINLYSDEPREGFEFYVIRYRKIVDRSECERVYREEPRFHLKSGGIYRYRDEKDGKILIELPYDDEDEEIIRLSYDEYGKWVPLSAGEKVTWTKEY